MTQTQYEIITEWQNETFPKATPVSCVNHLYEEVEELRYELENGNIDQNEIADCFLLLIGICNKAGMSYGDVVACISNKMAINLKRKWGEPNEKGYVKHIED